MSSRFDSECWICDVQSSIEAKGGGTSTTTEKADPWEAQQPYLKDLFGRAQEQSNVPQTYFPGQTYANPSAETEAALDAQTARAVGGSPITGAMQGSLLSTLRGDYLDPASNPAYQRAADNVMAKVMPAATAPYVAAGRYGSGLAARAAGEGAADAIGTLNYDAVNQERQRMMQANLFAPQAANQDYYDIAKLSEAGGARDALAQQGIDESVARFNFDQMEPWQRLAMYSNLIQGGFGGTATGSSTAPGTSKAAGVIGGGLTGAASGAMIGSAFPVVGTAAGAVAGGLLGALGGGIM